VPEHVKIASDALGRPVPVNCPVHHANGIKDDNRPENLVICEDNAHHRRIHTRLRAFQACGNPNWRQCRTCKEWSDPEVADMYLHPNTHIAEHRECKRERERAWQTARRAKKKAFVRAIHPYALEAV
jgi:hypothetical protein